MAAPNPARAMGHSLLLANSKVYIGMTTNYVPTATNGPNQLQHCIFKYPNTFDLIVDKNAGMNAKLEKTVCFRDANTYANTHTLAI